MSSEPTGLPKVDAKEQARIDAGAVDKSRICSSCGNEARVVANSSGVKAHCGPCKKWWPISSTPRAQEVPMVRGRGLRKETFVEPDWNKALDNVEGDLTHEQVGPKRR